MPRGGYGEDHQHRMELGRYILSALELLIVSDIIHTALSLALADLLFLGFLVLIRSMISFFLNREIRENPGRDRSLSRPTAPASVVSLGVV